MTVKEMGPAVATRRAFFLFDRRINRRKIAENFEKFITKKSAKRLIFKCFSGCYPLGCTGVHG